MLAAGQPRTGTVGDRSSRLVGACDDRRGGRLEGIVRCGAMAWRCDARGRGFLSIAYTMPAKLHSKPGTQKEWRKKRGQGRISPQQTMLRADGPFSFPRADCPSGTAMDGNRMR